MFPSTDAPQIIVQNSRLAVDMNETVALVCTAHSLPRPYFDWYHNGQKILTGGRHGLEVKQFGDDPRSYRYETTVSSAREKVSIRLCAQKQTWCALIGCYIQIYAVLIFFASI